MKIALIFTLLISTAQLTFAQVGNSQCNTALALLTQADQFDYCSTDAGYTTVGSATAHVWFKFIARRTDVTIGIIGNESGSAATLLAPNLSLYQDCGTNLVSSVSAVGNLTTLYKGGLIIGNTYYFSVSGSNLGSFKLCINNYTPVLEAGQDCSTASFLCNKQTFTQNNVVGGGTNNNEAAGTCLALPGVNTDQNSVWYKWTAANNGSLTFIITPSSRDDIDWVLFDLGVGGGCAQATPANAIRCAAGRGVDCNPSSQAVYTQTGLSLTAIDLNEAGGCLDGQDGFVKYVDMQQGHVYALLVNNFDVSNHSFTIEFGGTGEFVGPKAQIDFSEDTTCNVYTFTSLSANYTNLQWFFGEDATIGTRTGDGPFEVEYATSGLKTAVLSAFNSQGCAVVDTKVFTATAKYLPSSINADKTQYCLGDTIHLTVPTDPVVSYLWTGPGGFSSTQTAIDIPVINEAVAGIYSLHTIVNSCISGTVYKTIQPIAKNPQASFQIASQFSPGSSLLCAVCTFVNTSSNAESYLWDFGDSFTSTEINPQHTYTRDGIYNITLNAFSIGGCTSAVATAQLVINTGLKGVLDNSNIFTPNGDKINDEFTIDVLNLKSYKIQIFDRSGVQVFASDNMLEAWDGTHKNAPVPVGEYFYVIDAIDLSGNAVYKRGSVSLVR